ncbi:MAG: C25 family cysteine peptidase, partial [Chitinispirillaceae bacterium]|nr:C25 family cysteine peptidase [Chitinispirillaceae bacterium]
MVQHDYSKKEVVSLKYRVPPATVEYSGKKYKGISRKSIRQGNTRMHVKEGEPVVPVIPAQFIIPAGREIDEIRVIPGGKTEILGVHEIVHGEKPMPGSYIKGTEETKPDSSIYSSDGPFPAKPFHKVIIQTKNGISIAAVNIYPVEYHPRSGKLFYYKDMSLEVTTKPAISRAGRTGSRLRMPATADELIVDNPEALDSYQPPADYPFPGGGSTTLPCNPASNYEYIVITTRAMRDANTDYTLYDLVSHRISRGTSAAIITLEEIYSKYSGVDHQEKIRNFIIDAYNQWETRYVLLGGDVNVVPHRELHVFLDRQDGCGGDVFIPSDLYYQCLDGNYNSDNDERYGEATDGPGGTFPDFLAEVYIGRAGAEDQEEMSNFVYKTIVFENNNQKDPYTRSCLMAGEWMGLYWWASDGLENVRLGTPTTSGFVSNPKFFVDTLYAKKDAQSCYPTWEWTAADLIDSIQSCRFGIINHGGHGNKDKSLNMYSYDVDALTNQKPMFVYSWACYSGQIDDDCIMEHFATSNRSGAYAVIMNSRYGWSYPSPSFQGEFWDGLFGNDIKTLGGMNAHSHEAFLADIGSDFVGGYFRYVIYETNLLGDPRSPVANYEPVIAPSAFLQSASSQGIVSIEAEHYDLKAAQGGHDWTSTYNKTYAGGYAMRSTPDNGANVNTEYTTGSPRLDYNVNFVKTGTHYIWARGSGVNVAADSYHAGLDGQAIATCDRIQGFPVAPDWSKRTIDGPVASFTVSSPGVHTVNIWMREDGFIIDKIVITTDSTYTPSGTGPVESIKLGYAQQTDYYSITTSAGANGSISRTPEGDAYASGTVVTLTATPDPGYVFSGWSGDLTGTANPTTITMTGNKSVTANFTAQQNFTWETENLVYTGSRSCKTSPDVNASGGNFVEFSTAPTAAGTYWIEFTTPSLSAGFYSVSFLYKRNTNRGIARVSVDGVNLSKTVDMYGSSLHQQSGAPGTTALLAAGTHKIRFTTSSKNASSSGYAMALDQIKFTAVAQYTLALTALNGSIGFDIPG